MIDTHAHVFHRALPFVAGRRYTPDYDAIPASYLAQLDAHGVRHGVLVPVSILGTRNDYLLEAVAGSGGRLRGLVCIDEATPPAQLRQLAAPGICGFRLNLRGGPLPDLQGPAWRRLLAAAAALDWVASVHDGAARLPRVVQPLLDAGLRVVVDHFGRPDPALGATDPALAELFRLGAGARLWLKLSAPYRIGWDQAQRVAGRALERLGPQRLLWGSDWPFTGHEREGIRYGATLQRLAEWVPDEAERRRVLLHTPAELFGFATSGLVA